MDPEKRGIKQKKEKNEKSNWIFVFHYNEKPKRRIGFSVFFSESETFVFKREKKPPFIRYLSIAEKQNLEYVYYMGNK